jgi:hypothetical protein
MPARDDVIPLKHEQRFSLRARNRKEGMELMVKMVVLMSCRSGL